MRNLRSPLGKCSLLLIGLVLLVLPQAGGQTRKSQRPHHATTTTPPSQQPKFKMDCTLPELTVEALAIDKVCGNRGSSPENSDSAKQNLIKNRFCLPGSPTTATEIDFDTIDALQQAARDKHIHFGRKPDPNHPGETIEDLPTDRSLLVDLITVNGQKLGEGSLVTIEGFVFKAQHSNTFVFHSQGESVNCKGLASAKKLKSNDIHIALSRTKAGTQDTSEASECETVTAEITPHHRSAIYNRFDTNPADFLNGAHQKPGQDKLTGSPLPLKGARVRITGQLFFDGSHSPCFNGHGGPARRSIWEIHPVFEIRVFEPSQNDFISLANWVQMHSH